MCRAVEAITADELAELKSDVYFWWPMHAPAQNEVWLRQLMEAHRQTGRAAVAFVAHDTHHEPDMTTLGHLVSHYGATNVTRLFFDEGDFKNRVEKYGRPGRWGTFHLARFELGPHVPLPEWGRLPKRHRKGTPPDSKWHEGYCTLTQSDDSPELACEHQKKGSVPLGQLNIHSRADCVDFCFSRCKRCHYVSYSKELGDCSWYERCNLDNLLTTFNGGPKRLDFVTRRVEP
jgi:hypothetical protein